MIFASDNWSGASERVIAALAEAARKGGPAYGDDELTKGVTARFSETFEREVAVFLVASGTFANLLSLAAYARPGGIILGHRESHINVDEAGGAEFVTGGSKIVALEAEQGKITPEALEPILSRPIHGYHSGQLTTLSLTQLTELGAAYSVEEVTALAKLAKGAGLAVHMDGSRFANAIAATGATPAEMTWKAGVDVLSFGGTKNGCLAAEAVVFFDKAHARDAGFIRQRAGQGFSKNWFLAAQILAYLERGHWLDLARHANAMAARLAGALRSARRARLAFEPAGNELFAIVENGLDEKLRAAGAVYYPWPADSLPVAERPEPGETMIRLLTSWQTKVEEVERFADLVG
ncbi:MAG TPA: beta-eliminating lyase-related protein [Bauldia sp.]|nr:beta-eliminating lyase-related protein [Bauldia sp.]